MQNVNLSLDDTIHLSDVVLSGRIVAVAKGEFDTHTAVVSYYYSYKNDGLLPRRLFWSTSVTNFSPAPQLGQLGMFFLFREPNMQLALFCTTPIEMFLQSTEGSYQEIVDHINEVGLSKYSILIIGKTVQYSLKASPFVACITRWYCWIMHCKK